MVSLVAVLLISSGLLCYTPMVNQIRKSLRLKHFSVSHIVEYFYFIVYYFNLRRCSYSVLKIPPRYK